VKNSVAAANRILIPALALLAVLGSAIGQALYGEPGVGDHLPLLALGVLFSCWQSLFSWVLTGVDRQGLSAAIALVADGVQLALTWVTVARWGMGGYALSFTLASLLGAILTWVAAGRAIGLTLPVFDWFASPTLAACLATSCGELMETILLREGLTPLPAAGAALGFGVVLYVAGLEALGVKGAKSP
jgi:O-antigen/teichoic acid export membrane protein